MRKDKINYYLDIAEATLQRSTCIRRNFGAIIVKNDEIISTGYNGAPRGRKNCTDLGYCMREKLNIPRGERYELCRSVPSNVSSFSINSFTSITVYLVLVFLIYIFSIPEFIIILLHIAHGLASFTYSFVP